MTKVAEGTFNPSFHFLGLIQKAMADGAVRRCVLPGSPEVYLVPAENAYYTAAATVEALEALCLAAPFDLTVEVLPPDWQGDSGKGALQVGRMWLRRQAPSAPSNLSPRPLPELLWYAALCASRGQLLQGSRPDDPVRLKRWPDFSVLHHRESFMALAAFMAEESADLVSVAENTGVALTEVFDFYNACAVLGLIERGNVFEPQEYLLGLIQRSLADRRMRRCVLPGHSPLFIAPAEGMYYTAGDISSVTAVASALLLDLQVDIVESLGTDGDEEEVVQIGRMWVRRKKESAAPKLPPRPLSELQFLAALGASRGRLVAGSRLADPVRLKRWPEAVCLEQDRRFFPLAAFMTANAASLPTVAELTRIPLARVIDFHNACGAVGLLELAESERVRTRPVADGEREIYRKISRALDGLKAGLHVEQAY
jgi:hypothetical protein